MRYYQEIEHRIYKLFVAFVIILILIVLFSVWKSTLDPYSPFQVLTPFYVGFNFIAFLSAIIIAVFILIESIQNSEFISKKARMLGISPIIMLSATMVFILLF